jgi:hypothetical protein
LLELTYLITVTYASVCANGVLVPGRANMTYSSNGRACNGGLGGGAGGWGSWDGGFIPRPTPLGTEKQCPPPTDCESGSCPGANAGPNDVGRVKTRTELRRTPSQTR